MLNRILQWIMDNKVVTLLSVLLFSFFVSTIAVAVKSSNRYDEWQVCEAKLNALATTTTTASTDTTTTASTDTTATTTSTTDAASTTPSNTTKPEKSYRLPSEVIPSHYTVTLRPNIKENTFEGDVEIEVNVTKAVEEIVLHSNLLEITSAVMKKAAGDIPLKFNLTDDDTELLQLKAAAAIAQGVHVIHIKYKGKMDGIVGLYTSTLSDNETKIVTSKFEPTYARQAFPCFDEPAMKAKFTVHLYKPKDYIALSNMDVVSTNTSLGDADLVTFEESVPMSTYLACFIICNFDHVNDTILTGGIGKNFNMSVYTAKGQKEKAEFSLDIGKRVTEYYIKYFEEEYPLTKLDMIAIPDFVSGAMEHWGLVTFKETNLLYDETTTSTANQQNIARVVAHEVAHMWFGNLVTMKWWNELWLNEGFASYMQYKAVNEIEKDWQMLDQFLTANSHSVYAFDGTLASHPIVQTVETPDEITTIFDSITYNKGAAVIRMLEGFVGLDDFQKGVASYMKKHKFSNTETQDLLNEIDIQFKPSNPNHNLTHIMNTWTRQTGLPVVSVTKKDDKTYTLTQKRFLADPDTKPNVTSEFNDKWYIPITYKTDKPNTSEILWFSDKADSVNITLKDGAKLLKVNNDQIGYYRVNYEDSMWKQLEEDLKNSSTFGTSDRAHLLNDAFALASASAINYTVPLSLAGFLQKEQDYVPWSAAASELLGMKRIMANSKAFIEFKQYVKNLVKNAVDFVKWDEDTNDTHVIKLLRPTVLDLACSMDNETCLSEAADRFKKYLANTSHPVDPNLKSIIYSYGIAGTGDSEWLKLWDIYTQETDAQEQAKLMSALTASRSPSILTRYLTLAWDEAYIRAQDHLSIVQQISRNPIGTSLVWDHLRDNWPRFVEKFTLNSRVLGTTVPAVTRSFATETKLTEMEAFFAKYPEAGAGASPREQAKENVKNNIKWLAVHEPNVSEWLMSNVRYS